MLLRGPPISYPVAGHFGAGPGIDVGQLVGAVLGMVPPQYAGIVQSAMRQAASHRSSVRRPVGMIPLSTLLPLDANRQQREHALPPPRRLPLSRT